MSKTNILLLVLAGAAALGLLVYFSSQSSPLTGPGAYTGPSSGPAGLVRSIGAGLTGIVSAIVGAVDTSETATDSVASEIAAEDDAVRAGTT